MKKLKLLPVSIIALIALSACAGAAPSSVKPTEAVAKPTEAVPKPTEAVPKPTEAMPKPTEAMPKPTEAMPKPTEAMPRPTEAMPKPDWMTMKLTDVRTGKTFMLSDFAGKTVFVETMATWCSNCAQQLRYVRDARKQLNPEKVVFIGLSVESDLAPTELAKYADKAGLDFQFAILDTGALKALVDAFGFSAINPPSTPHFVIRPDGAVSKLATGFEDAAALVKSLGGQ